MNGCFGYRSVHFAQGTRMVWLTLVLYEVCRLNAIVSYLPLCSLLATGFYLPRTLPSLRHTTRL